MPKCVLGKVKQDNAGQLWPLALVTAVLYVSSLQAHVSCWLNNHFFAFFYLP